MESKAGLRQVKRGEDTHETLYYYYDYYDYYDYDCFCGSADSKRFLLYRLYFEEEEGEGERWDRQRR